MKKFFGIIIFAVLLTSCGVGSYSVSSGKADGGELSFTFDKTTEIVVFIDNNTYNICAVKDKAYKKDRKIKKTSQNTIRVSPGSHEVKVIISGNEVYSKKVFISTSEHKIIEL